MVGFWSQAILWVIILSAIKCFELSATQVSRSFFVRNILVLFIFARKMIDLICTT